jgi:hypothetical protein
VKGKEKAISLDGEFISKFLHIVDNSHFTPLSLFAFVFVSFSKVESGAFYLDRVPRVKHVAGPFFSEGTHTKNTPEEVRGRNVLMGKL